MGIKCSLFGHAFGESTVERDREEQGSEVVSTIREIQTCERCGETRIVSENKEVTTLETPDDVDPEPATDHRPSDEPTTDTSSAIVDAESDEAVTADASETESAVDPEQEEAPTADDAEQPTVTDDTEQPPVTDDAEILDEDDEQAANREPGEWPQETDETSPGDEDFDQFGYTDEETETDDDAEFIDENEDAEFIDEDAEPAPEEPADEDEEFDDGTQTSQPQAAQTNEWPSERDIDAAGEPESAGPGAVTVPDGQFHCESCGFSTPVESSSLREGDFCPECHKDTLVQVRDVE